MRKKTVEPVVAITETNCTTHPYKRICWSAIFVGAIVGIGLGFLLNLFGLAIGLTATTVTKEGGIAIAMGGFIGVIIATIASMMAAGYAAGYLGRMYNPARNLGIIYGFVTWSVALILSAILIAHVSNYVTTYAHIIGSPTITVHEDTNKTTTVTTETRANDNNKTKAEVGASDLVQGAFILFALFFIGAVSTCCGAIWGMTSDRDY